MVRGSATAVPRKILIPGRILSITLSGVTTVEFQLLDALYREPGRIFSRSQLIDRIYDDHRIVSERTIDSHIKKLRKKLAKLLPEQELIHSVYGAGYRYEVDRKIHQHP